MCFWTAVGCIVSLQSNAQGVWDDPFESTLRTHRSTAWSLSFGTRSMLSMPTSWDSQWTLNHGTAESPALDTLHAGVMFARPQTGWGASLGHLQMTPDLLWVDRILVKVGVSYLRGKEQFLGLSKPSNTGDTSLVMATSWQGVEASSWSVDVEAQALHARATGPEGFVEFMTGLRGSFRFDQSHTSNAPYLFPHVKLPSWNVALVAGAGAGLKVYRGRMVRVQWTVDLLQLAQASSPSGPRVVDIDARGLHWMQGGYRPWRVSFAHDLFRKKPAEGCAAPTRSTASKTLFDPKMKGVGKAKFKGGKKARKQRGGK